MSEVVTHPPSWEDLRHQVVTGGGVLRLRMGVLRELAGYGRLGTNVRQVLSARLSSFGLGHLPADLPPNQDSDILLYQYGTPAADVIDALRGRVTAEAESALVQLNTSRDVERVREAAIKAAELLTVLSDRCGACVGPLS